MNVSLTPALEEFVRSKVRSGGYESASEVVREGLRVLKQREQIGSEFWMIAKEKLAFARKQVEMGLTVDGASAMDGLIAELGAGGEKMRSAGRRSSKVRSKSRAKPAGKRAR